MYTAHTDQAGKSTEFSPTGDPYFFLPPFPLFYLFICSFNHLYQQGLMAISADALGYNLIPLHLLSSSNCCSCAESFVSWLFSLIYP